MKEDLSFTLYWADIRIKSDTEEWKRPTSVTWFWKWENKEHDSEKWTKSVLGKMDYKSDVQTQVLVCKKHGNTQMKFCKE